MQNEKEVLDLQSKMCIASKISVFKSIRNLVLQSVFGIQVDDSILVVDPREDQFK